MALGARRETIVWMVARESFALVAAGVALSAPAVYAGAKMVSALLYGLRPLEPAVLGTAAIALLATACLAVYLPARHAANVDPMVAMRCE